MKSFAAISFLTTLALAAPSAMPQDPHVPKKRETSIGVLNKELNYGSTKPDDVVLTVLNREYCPKTAGCKYESKDEISTYYKEGEGTKQKFLTVDITGTYKNEEMRNLLFVAASTAMAEGAKDEIVIEGQPETHAYRQGCGVSVSVWDEDDDMKGDLHIEVKYPDEPDGPTDVWCETGVQAASSIAGILSKANPLFGVAAGAFGLVNIACQRF